MALRSRRAAIIALSRNSHAFGNAPSPPDSRIFSPIPHFSRLNGVLSFGLHPLQAQSTGDAQQAAPQPSMSRGPRVPVIFVTEQGPAALVQLEPPTMAEYNASAARDSAEHPVMGVWSLIAHALNKLGYCGTNTGASASSSSKTTGPEPFSSASSREAPLSGVGSSLSSFPWGSGLVHNSNSRLSSPSIRSFPNQDGSVGRFPEGADAGGAPNVASSTEYTGSWIQQTYGEEYDMQELASAQALHQMQLAEPLVPFHPTIPRGPFSVRGSDEWRSSRKQGASATGRQRGSRSPNPARHSAALSAGTNSWGELSDGSLQEDSTRSGEQQPRRGRPRRAASRKVYSAKGRSRMPLLSRNKVKLMSRELRASLSWMRPPEAVRAEVADLARLVGFEHPSFIGPFDVSTQHHEGGRGERVEHMGAVAGSGAPAPYAPLHSDEEDDEDVAPPSAKRARTQGGLASRGPVRFPMPPLLPPPVTLPAQRPLPPPTLAQPPPAAPHVPVTDPLTLPAVPPSPASSSTARVDRVPGLTAVARGARSSTAALPREDGPSERPRRRVRPSALKDPAWASDEENAEDEALTDGDFESAQPRTNRKRRRPESSSAITRVPGGGEHRGKPSTAFLKSPIRDVRLVQTDDDEYALAFSVPDDYLDVELMANPGRLPPRVTMAMRQWMAEPENWLHPYPDDSEKTKLMAITGLDRTQVSNWFRNERKRIWLPLRRRAEKMWETEHQRQLPKMRKLK